MSRYNQITGVPHTCRTIDAAIAEIEELADFAVPGYIITKEDVATIKDTIKTINERMEEIRGHNQDLRDFGETTHGELEECRTKCDELEGQLDTAKQDAEDFEERCKLLEEEALEAV